MGATFFSRIKPSRQCAAIRAGIPPAEAGTPGMAYLDDGRNVFQPDQAFPAVCRDPGQHAID
jgi:hypothetical protein